MTDKEKNFVSAVIYVHNAENRAGDFLKTVIRILEENFEHSEIICVNDSSDDDSLDIIKNAAVTASCVRVSVVNMSYFYGLETAMDAGLDLSVGDFVFEFDHTVSDFEPALIMDIYRHSLQGYDIVSAVPKGREKITSRLFYQLFNRFADFPCQLHTESFRILSRRVINRIHSMNKTILYRKAVYASQGLKTDTVTYQAVSNIERGGVNQDKQMRSYRLRLAVDSLILFTQIGYRFSIAMTLLMMFVSVFMTVYSAAVYLSSSPAAGWTTTILFLSAAFFGLFGILTLVIKYLQLLVDLAFKRKHYSFESVEKLTR